MLKKRFLKKFLNISLYRLDASCKAYVRSISPASSADIFPLTCNSWPFPPALLWACVSDEQGNLSPVALQTFREDRRQYILLCLLPISLLPSLPTLTSHNFSRCCLVPQHLFPSLWFSQFNNLWRLERCRLTRKASSHWITLRPSPLSKSKQSGYKLHNSQVKVWKMEDFSFTFFFLIPMLLSLALHFSWYRKWDLIIFRKNCSTLMISQSFLV